MENLNDQKQEIKPKKKSAYKNKIFAFLLIIIFFLFVYGYFWYQSTQKLRTEAQGVIKKANKYDDLLTEVQKEYNRCENFITQQEGNFGSFEYCKKFIEWRNQ